MYFINKVVGIIIAVGGFIGGIVAGNTFKIVTISSYSARLNTAEFNWKIMFMVWISAAILALIFISLSKIFELLDSNNYYLSKQEERYESQKPKEEKIPKSYKITDK